MPTIRFPPSLIAEAWSRAPGADAGNWLSRPSRYTTANLGRGSRADSVIVPTAVPELSTSASVMPGRWLTSVGSPPTRQIAGYRRWLSGVESEPYRDPVTQPLRIRAGGALPDRASRVDRACGLPYPWP